MRRLGYDVHVEHGTAPMSDRMWYFDASRWALPIADSAAVVTAIWLWEKGYRGFQLVIWLLVTFGACLWTGLAVAVGVRKLTRSARARTD